MVNNSYKARSEELDKRLKGASIMIDKVLFDETITDLERREKIGLINEIINETEVKKMELDRLYKSSLASQPQIEVPEPPKESTESKQEEPSVLDKLTGGTEGASGTCSVSKIAEVVGREYIEALLPARDAKTTSMIDNIRHINEGIGGVGQAVQEIAIIHGPPKGFGGETLGALGSIFGGADGGFAQTIHQLESAADGVLDAIDNAENLVDTFKTLTFSDVGTALTRAYLRNVETLLPKGISDAISSNIQQFPMFAKISESLGLVFYNMKILNNGIDLIDGVMQDVMDSTGLSTLLGQHSLVRMLPQYAMNLHQNIRLVQRLAMRFMPPCTFGKLFHKMDKALAHMYDFANDVLSYLNILDNRKAYLQALVGQYGSFLSLVNNFYPICHEYTAPNDLKQVDVDGRKVDVDILGNPKKRGSRQGMLSNDSQLVLQ